MVRTKIALLTTLIFLFNAFSAFVFDKAIASTPLKDMPDSSLYTPAIEVYLENNIIVGDTLGGKPIGKLRPDDFIKRAEFTKLSTINHLLEQIYTGVIAKDLDDYLGVDLDTFTLHINTLLIPYYAAKSESIKFSDVPDKDIHCAKDPNGCEPWYTQFVNYASALRTVQGYDDGKFRPDAPIKRIHALKLVIAEDGSVPASQDSKFRRLSSLERIQGREPNCLAGTEDLILEKNGGAGSQDARNLLAYALLADKLDMFGNSCQVFKEKQIALTDKTAIVDYLQADLTRKEIARYFALTTQIPQLQLAPATDQTVDTKSERISHPTEIKNEKDPLIGKIPFYNPNSTENTPTKTSPVTPKESKLNIIDETIPVYPYPEKEIELCNYIPIGRENTGQMIQDCIDTLRLYGYSDTVIESMLKQAGYWGYVKDTFAANPIIEKKEETAALSYTNVCYFAPDMCEQAKALNNVLSQANKVAEHMDENFQVTGDALQTCKWAFRGKEKGTDKYIYMMTWCNAHGVTEEDLVPTPIDTVYTATGIGPNGIHESLFHIKSKGNTDSYTASDQNLYILIHGWRSSSDAWASDMADTILQDDPLAQILLLNWTTIATDLYDGGLSMYAASTWIDSIADSTSMALKDWGIQNNKTNIIGHSLGALLAKELAEKLEGKQPSSRLQDITLITLDPAAYYHEYRVDIEGREFSTFAQSGACFVADASWAGSETLMQTCQEGYLIDYSGNPRSQFLAEVFEYVDIVIDENVAGYAQVIKKDGKTYSTDDLANTKEGNRIPGIRMYKIIDEKLHEIFEGDLLSAACERVDKITRLPNICQYGLNTVKDRFLTYHQNVYKTYDTLLENPLYGNLLSPADVGSRKYALFSLMHDTVLGIWNKSTHGIIYTEKDDPQNIKYLKAQNTKTPDRFTLYGNTLNNTFECDSEKECDMYGYWNTDRYGRNLNEVGDQFILNEYSASYTIEDFRFHEDPDKILISTIWPEDVTVPEGENKIRFKFVSPGKQDDKPDTIITVSLPGYSYEEVKGWVDIATGEYRKTEEGRMLSRLDWEKKRADNAIQIK